MQMMGHINLGFVEMLYRTWMIATWFVFSLTLCLLVGASNWEEGMPGGVKIGIGDKLYSFTTDMCSGGIFFKKPVKLDLICPHGYFFRRPKGCKMKGSDIIAGENYVCQEYKKKSHRPSLQALVPLTPPELPLDHSIALFDDADTLQNFRRYAYIKAMKNKYNSAKETGARWVVISNSHNTPPVNIGKLCYDGEPETNGAAFLANVTGDFDDGGSFGFFKRPCKPNSIDIYLDGSQRYSFKDGYSEPERFKGEIRARATGIFPDEDNSAENAIGSGEEGENVSIEKMTESPSNQGAGTGGQAENRQKQGQAQGQSKDKKKTGSDPSKSKDGQQVKIGAKKQPPIKSSDNDPPGESTGQMGSTQPNAERENSPAESDGGNQPSSNSTDDNDLPPATDTQTPKPAAPKTGKGIEKVKTQRQPGNKDEIKGAIKGKDPRVATAGQGVNFKESSTDPSDGQGVPSPSSDDVNEVKAREKLAVGDKDKTVLESEPESEVTSKPGEESESSSEEEDTWINFPEDQTTEEPENKVPEGNKTGRRVTSGSNKTKVEQGGIASLDWPPKIKPGSGQQLRSNVENATGDDIGIGPGPLLNWPKDHPSGGAISKPTEKEDAEYSESEEDEDQFIDFPEGQDEPPGKHDATTSKDPKSDTQGGLDVETRLLWPSTNGSHAQNNGAKVGPDTRIVDKGQADLNEGHGSDNGSIDLPDGQSQHVSGEKVDTGSSVDDTKFIDWPPGKTGRYIAPVQAQRQHDSGAAEKEKFIDFQPDPSPSSDLDSEPGQINSGVNTTGTFIDFQPDPGPTFIDFQLGDGDKNETASESGSGSESDSYSESDSESGSSSSSDEEYVDYSESKERADELKKAGIILQPNGGKGQGQLKNQENLKYATIKLNWTSNGKGQDQGAPTGGPGAMTEMGPQTATKGQEDLTEGEGHDSDNSLGSVQPKKSGKGIGAVTNKNRGQGSGNKKKKGATKPKSLGRKTEALQASDLHVDQTQQPEGSGGGGVEMNSGGHGQDNGNKQGDMDAGAGMETLIGWPKNQSQSQPTEASKGAPKINNGGQGQTNTQVGKNSGHDQDNGSKQGDKDAVTGKEFLIDWPNSQSKSQPPTGTDSGPQRSSSTSTGQDQFNVTSKPGEESEESSEEDYVSIDFPASDRKSEKPSNEGTESAKTAEMTALEWLSKHKPGSGQKVPLKPDAGTETGTSPITERSDNQPPEGSKGNGEGGEIGENLPAIQWAQGETGKNGDQTQLGKGQGRYVSAGKHNASSGEEGTTFIDWGDSSQTSGKEGQSQHGQVQGQNEHVSGGNRNTSEEDGGSESEEDEEEFIDFPDGQEVPAGKHGDILPSPDPRIAATKPANLNESTTDASEAQGVQSGGHGEAPGIADKDHEEKLNGSIETSNVQGVPTGAMLGQYRGQHGKDEDRYVSGIKNNTSGSGEEGSTFIDFIGDESDGDKKPTFIDLTKSESGEDEGSTFIDWKSGESDRDEGSTFIDWKGGESGGKTGQGQHGKGQGRLASGLKQNTSGEVEGSTFTDREEGEAGKNLGQGQQVSTGSHDTSDINEGLPITDRPKEQNSKKLVQVPPKGQGNRFGSVTGKPKPATEGNVEGSGETADDVWIEFSPTGEPEENESKKPILEIYRHSPIKLKKFPTLSDTLTNWDPFLEESVVLAKYTIMSDLGHTGGFDFATGRVLSGGSGNGNRKGSTYDGNNNPLSQVSGTMWYKITLAAAEVTKVLFPPSLIEPQFFDDVLKLFGYFFRNIPDLPDYLSEETFGTIISALDSCTSNSVAMNVTGTGCPAVFEQLLVKSEYDEVKDYHFENLPPLSNSYRSRTTDIVVESAWNFIDIAVSTCFPSFTPDNVNDHHRLFVYMKDIFRSDRIQERWFSIPKRVDLYAGLLAYPDKKVIMHNFDKLKAAAHFNTLYSEWIPKPEVMVANYGQANIRVPKTKAPNIKKKPWETRTDDSQPNETPQQSNNEDPFIMGTKPIKYVRPFRARGTHKQTVHWRRRQKREIRNAEWARVKRRRKRQAGAQFYMRDAKKPVMKRQLGPYTDFSVGTTPASNPNQEKGQSLTTDNYSDNGPTLDNEDTSTKDEQGGNEVNLDPKIVLPQKQGPAKPKLSRMFKSGQVQNQDQSSESTTSSDRESAEAAFKKYEIWDGLAYCLQANYDLTPDNKLSMRGISPSIEDLEPMCDS